MYKNTESIHYCTILSAEQWNFLLDCKSSVLRLRCLHRLMTDAVRTETSYHIKGIRVALEVGQAAASDVELAAYLGCNRKTVGKLIDSFNRLGMLTTRTNNRTSMHTLHFLTGWYVNGVLLTNPHYVRPSANADGQTHGTRTPHPNDMPPTDGHDIGEDRRQGKRQGVVSLVEIAAALSSPLLSPMASDRLLIRQDTGSRTGISRTTKHENVPPCVNPHERRI